MTLDDIINEYSKTVSTIAADLASGLLDGVALEQQKQNYELFKAGRDALVEKKNRCEGSD